MNADGSEQVERQLKGVLTCPGYEILSDAESKLGGEVEAGNEFCIICESL